MKGISRLLVLAALGSLLTAANALALDPTLTWNTFLGGAGYDAGNDIAIDASGNVYVIGQSADTWGAPIRPSAGSYDAFVAKLDSKGALLWNTYLGGSFEDNGFGIAVDASGNVFVTGFAAGTFGAPIRPPAGNHDAFVAKLDSNGALAWNTWLGGVGNDYGSGIAVDASGNISIVGWSGVTWGDPIRAFDGGGYDNAFTAKLDTSGALLWNTFLGPMDAFSHPGIAVDTGGNAYVSGGSPATWGAPIRPWAGAVDAFVAKIDGNGALLWNTFLGGMFSADEGSAIAVDADGNVIIAGWSSMTWGAPIRQLTVGSVDAFAAKLDGNGVLLWNTFLGGMYDDRGFGVAVDAGGAVSVTGKSPGPWGDPIRPYSGAPYAVDTFVARLDGNGALLWNTFLGGANHDWGTGIAVDANGNACVTGWSYETWGDPIRAFVDREAFVACIPADPFPGQAVLISPTGRSRRNPPKYFWHAVPGAEWYDHWVDDSTGTRVNEWLTAAQAHCPAGTEDCWARPAVPLAAGKAMWWIQTWNAAGYGPWSDGMAFRVR